MKSASCCVVVAVALCGAVAGARSARTIAYDEARPVLDALRPDLLPAELRALPPDARAAAWPAWVDRRNADIRQRLARGDEESVATLLLFGVTFTTQPRYTFGAWAAGTPPPGPAEDVVAADAVVRARIRDLAAAAAEPGASERLRFVRDVLARHGIMPGTPEGRRAAEGFLDEALRRLLADYDEYFRDRSVGATLFRNRGLASDTSVHAAFAIDRALADLAGRGLLPPASVRRVAVIGPGLDFADKQEGLDFYPVQTIQPFAVVDSLVALGATAPPQVTTYDISARVNQHLEAAVREARAGREYVLHLPRDPAQGWTPELTAYWSRLGDRIGRAAPAMPPPAGLGMLEMRAVALAPAFVQAMTPADLNVVLQRPDQTDPFDLVVVTNLLIYYDVFEQSLALANIASMLRPGGILLTNNPVFVLPGIPMRLAGETPVAYTATGRDWVIWYQRD